MPNYNAQNERIKRTYFTHMKQAMQYSDQSSTRWLQPSIGSEFSPNLNRPEFAGGSEP